MKVWLSGFEKLLMSRADLSGHSAGGLEDKSAKRNVDSGGSAYESSQGDKDSIRNWIGAICRMSWQRSGHTLLS